MNISKEELRGMIREIIREEKRTEERKKKECVLPWCGVIMEENCEGIKLNHGLYTQCEKRKEEGSAYCRICEKQSEKNKDGKPNNGTIKDRLEKGWKDRKGRGPERYIKVMRKLSISKEEAESVARSKGWKIPEEEYEMEYRRRGRPRKEEKEKRIKTEDTSSSDDEKIGRRGRGRPRKTKKEIKRKDETEDLIATLIREARSESDTEESDDNKESIEVSNFEYEGNKYLKDKTGKVYDIEDQKLIGIYKDEKVVFN